MKYKYSENGVKHLEQWEDTILVAYLAPEGQWTIGIGSTYIPAGFGVNYNGEFIIPSKQMPVKQGMKLESAEHARRIALHTINKTYGKAVNDLVKVPITQSMYDALVSFTYNVGTGGLKQSSVLRELNNKNYEKAAVSFVSWNKHYSPSQGKLDHSEGLIRRRQSEMELFIEGFNDYMNKPSKNEPKKSFWQSIFK